MYITALGIMTGTSCDGVNLAVMQTDGMSLIKRLDYAEQPFNPVLARRLKQCGFNARQHNKIDMNDPEIIQLTDDYTEFVIETIRHHIQDLSKIDLIGFHGQTILHQPELYKTYQIGNPQLIADRLGIDVVFNFRQNDMNHFGQGAPLAPLYHAACVADVPAPATFVNIGGVSNVTYCGTPILGFDIGTGNCLSDDLAMRYFNVPYDKDGALAAQGKIHYDIVHEIAAYPIFQKPPPKSFDRNDFNTPQLKALVPHDAIATANYLTAYLIASADIFYPTPPAIRIISGGGVKNKILMQHLENLSTIPVKPAEAIGLSADAIEAECFAWLAVRSILGLPLSEPSITGCTKAVSGGNLYRKSA